MSRTLSLDCIPSRNAISIPTYFTISGSNNGRNSKSTFAKRIYDVGYERLESTITGTTDKITSRYFFSGDNTANPNKPVQQVKFADGTTWNMATILSKVFAGTTGADTIAGTIAADAINGQAGADVLSGRDGNDTLNGGADADTLSGESGNDTLDGGAGNDNINGGFGNDTYLFARGSSSDLFSDYDTTAGNVDLLLFGSFIGTSQLRFRRVGSDLEVSIIGTTDKALVSGWYSGAAFHLEQFKTADGRTLLDSKVDGLISAMAGFAQPALGQTTLPATYQTTLNPVITANWT